MAKLEPGIIIGPCSECRFWQRNPASEPDTAGLQNDYGDCQLFSYDSSQPTPENQPEALAIVHAGAGADGATFETYKDFGCVQWQRTP